MIKVNGKTHQDKAGITLSDLLHQLNYQLDSIIVKHNKNIIKFNQFKSVIIEDGDQIKVFPFVGGG